MATVDEIRSAKSSQCSNDAREAFPEVGVVSTPPTHPDRSSTLYDFVRGNTLLVSNVFASPLLTKWTFARYVEFVCEIVANVVTRGVEM